MIRFLTITFFLLYMVSLPVFALESGISNRYSLLMITNGDNGILGIGTHIQFSQVFELVPLKAEGFGPLLALGYAAELQGGFYGELPFFYLDFEPVGIAGGSIGVEAKLFNLVLFQLLAGGSWIKDGFDFVVSSRILFEYFSPGSMVGINLGFCIDFPFAHELFWGFKSGLSLRF
ncbi:MAG: hypothetical protein JW904_07415 [Spirochaetales bacterium]|nr:hypothetical protein [Spirochaetales bacterium]